MYLMSSFDVCALHTLYYFYFHIIKLFLYASSKDYNNSNGWSSFDLIYINGYMENTAIGGAKTILIISQSI